MILKTCKYQWLSKMYGSQNVFDNLGFSGFQRRLRKLIAERGITEECKLQNNPCFVISALSLIIHCRKIIVFLDILHGIVNCSSSSDVPFLPGHASSFIHSLSDWMPVFYLVIHQTTVLSPAKICFFDLWTLIWLNATACPPNSPWFTALKGIKSNRSLYVYTLSVGFPSIP